MTCDKDIATGEGGFIIVLVVNANCIIIHTSSEV
jgi:hypothetical protein